MQPTSGACTMPRFSQACLLGYTPSPQHAFQGAAAHQAQRRTWLTPNDSPGTWYTLRDYWLQLDPSSIPSYSLYGAHMDSTTYCGGVCLSHPSTPNIVLRVSWPRVALCGYTWTMSCRLPDDPGIHRRNNFEVHRLVCQAGRGRWIIAADLARNRHLRLGEAVNLQDRPAQGNIRAGLTQNAPSH